MLEKILLHVISAAKCTSFEYHNVTGSKYMLCLN